HKSDLESLIQVMIIIFGDHPPVFAKPKADPVMPHQLVNSIPYPKQSVMPMPHVLAQSGYPQPPQPIVSNVFVSADVQYPNYSYSNSISNYPMPGYSGPYPSYSSVSNR
ncbi:tumor susceptibility gene 101 protein-like, partial [Copidosoma floridanum]|uniref:tumor susceptibility gene 101 protein-like n=1 Tax=Copidosoma floridanum TaxID=29053 RepID=UPI000C6F4FB2